VSLNSNTMTNSLFGDAEMPAIAAPKLSNCDVWNLAESLEKEKDMVGIYLSAHPLDGFQIEMNHFGFLHLSDIEDDRLKNQPLKMAGYISSSLDLLSKKGTKWGRFKIVDYHGEFEFALFGEDYLKYKDMLSTDNKVVIHGKFQPRFYDPTQFEFKVSGVSLLENVLKTMTKRLNLQIDMHQFDSKLLNTLLKYADSSASCQVGILVVDKETGDQIKLKTATKKLAIHEGLLDELAKIEGVSYELVTN
jgi:DNA polymerase III subunit alpha